MYVAVVNITNQQIPWAVAFSHYFPFINSIGNPIIYTLTNKTYGDFVRNLFTKFKVVVIEGGSSQLYGADTSSRMVSRDYQKGQQKSVQIKMPANGEEEEKKEVDVEKLILKPSRSVSPVFSPGSTEKEPDEVNTGRRSEDV